MFGHGFQIAKRYGQQEHRGDSMQVSFSVIDRRTENGPIMLPAAQPIEEPGQSVESIVSHPILTAMVTVSTKTMFSSFAVAKNQ